MPTQHAIILLYNDRSCYCFRGEHAATRKFCGNAWGHRLARVNFTNNLQRHLSCATVEVTGDTVQAVLESVFETNPKLRSYLLDDQGRLRQHVKVFVNNRAVANHNDLSDRVRDSDEVFVFQALSGG